MNARTGLGKLRFAWFALLLLYPIAPARAATAVQAKYATVSAALQTGASPGEADWVAIHFAMAPGWHTYWRNAGTAGYAATIDWALPKGVSAGAIRWPVPERFKTSDIVDYGYAGETTLLVPLSVAAGADTGGKASAKISWLLCSDACVPEQTVLQLPLAKAFGDAALFRQAFAALPKSFGGTAKMSISQNDLTLELSGAGVSDLQNVQFFPATPRVIDDAVAPRIARNSDGLRIVLARAKPPAPVKSFAGVLVAGGRAFSFTATPQATAPAAPPAANVFSSTLIGAVLMAFLGGLILNLMPCVLPILSMKALAIVRAHESPQRMRRDGIFYLAGVLATFAFTAASLIALKSAGAAVGWGFQLQSPFVVLILCLVTAAIGLNLLGAFELPLAFAGIGSGLAAGGSGRGAFFTGVLAVLVASPCTAPFMGAALGYALTEPPPIAFAVFVALGIGFAAPFTLFAFIPKAAAPDPAPRPLDEPAQGVLRISDARHRDLAVVGAGAGSRLLGPRGRAVARPWLDVPRLARARAQAVVALDGRRGRRSGLRHRRIPATAGIRPDLSGAGVAGLVAASRSRGAGLRPSRAGRFLGGLVHHLPRQRTRGPGRPFRRAASRTRPRGDAERRLDQPQRRHRRATGRSRPRRRAALSALSGAGGSAGGAAAATDPAIGGNGAGADRRRRQKESHPAKIVDERSRCGPHLDKHHSWR